MFCARLVKICLMEDSKTILKKRKKRDVNMVEREKMMPENFSRGSISNELVKSIEALYMT